MTKSQERQQALTDSLEQRVLVLDGAMGTKDFLQPGLIYGAAVTKGWGSIDLISLDITLMFGTTGLPHILVRFYTVPNARTARSSVV